MKNCHVPHGSLNFELRTLNFDLRSLMSDSELILYSVTDFRPLRTWVDIISRLTLQRYYMRGAVYKFFSLLFQN